MNAPRKLTAEEIEEYFAPIRAREQRAARTAAWKALPAGDPVRMRHERRVAAQRKYAATPKGQAANARYDRTDKRRASYDTYNWSTKGMQRTARAHVANAQAMVAMLTAEL